MQRLSMFTLFTCVVVACLAVIAQLKWGVAKKVGLYNLRHELDR